MRKTRSLSDEEGSKKGVLEKMSSLDDAQRSPTSPRPSMLFPNRLTPHKKTSTLPSPIIEHQPENKTHATEPRVPAAAQAQPNPKLPARLNRKYAFRRKTISDLVVPSAGSKVIRVSSSWGHWDNWGSRFGRGPSKGVGHSP